MVATACGDSSGRGDGAGGGTGDLGTGDGTTDTGSTTSDSDHGSTDEDADIVSVEIQPADPVLVVRDGMIPPPVEFRAIGQTDTGARVELSGNWTTTNSTWPRSSYT